MQLIRRASSAGPVAYQYVPGHSQVLGNELVDQLAKAAARGNGLGSLDEAGGQAWLRAGGPLLPWVALACRSLQQQLSWPDVTSRTLAAQADTVLDAEALLRPFLPPGPSAGGPSSAASAQATDLPANPSPACAFEDSALTVKIASYNVLTLAAPASRQSIGEGLAYQVARPSLLAQCLEEANVDIAAIQESRCPSGTLNAGPFYSLLWG